LFFFSSSRPKIRESAEMPLLLCVLAIFAHSVGHVSADCRSFGLTPLTFGTFFPNPTPLTGLAGSLTSPKYPNDYNSFEQCAYIIWGPAGSNVTITFQVPDGS
jgi:hypothetical protein